MSMQKLAMHIIEVGNRNKRYMTNWHLQKTMYFTLQYAIRQRLYTPAELLELYDEPFLVWRLGPISQRIYEWYGLFGTSPIIDEGNYDEHFARLDREILRLLEFDDIALIEQSYKEAFWLHHEPEIENWRSKVAYGLEDIACG